MGSGYTIHKRGRGNGSSFKSIAQFDFTPPIGNDQIGPVGDQWTDGGLWTPDEDKVIRDQLAAPCERAPLGTWPEVALHLGRTPGAVRHRASNLRQADREA